MARLVATALVALLASAATSGAGAKAGDAAPALTRAEGDLQFVPGELIVRFRDDVPAAGRSTALQARGARTVRRLGGPGATLVELREGASVAAEAAALARDPRVLYAEPNHLYRVSAVPNDPMFPQLWGLDQASDKDIDAPEAWDLHTGNKRVVVAVIDTGIAYGHPDLAPNIWINTKDPAGGGDQDKNGFANDTRGWDFVQKDNTPLDFNGHGTHVAGTIGAKGDNALGVTGVNWDVSLMPIRAADAYGSLTAANIAAAIAYACANGAHVVNGSFGGPAPNTTIANAVTSAACQKTLFVFAAGNDGWNLNGNTGTNDRSYPCELHLPAPAGVGAGNVLCVAASDQADARPTFSNYGDSSVHIAAPGHPIPSTWPAWTQIYFDGFETLGTWGDRIRSPSTAPLWNRTSVHATTGTFSLTDSPTGDYRNASQTSIRNLTAVTTTGRTGCLLDYDLRLDSQAGDGLVVAAGTTTNPPTDLSGWSGSTGGDFESLTDDLSAFDKRPAVYIRLWFLSNNDNIQDDGAYVDDLRVRCLANSTAGYESISGTSMATPHVAGVAALLLDRNPGLTVAQLKAAILDGADVVAGFPVMGGRRLNARGALEQVADAPPDTFVLAGPPAFTNKKAASLTFAASETATFDCSHDGAPYEPCVSPVTLTGLAAGTHTFHVRAIDSADQVDATPASRNWTVDLTPPNTRIAAGPKGKVKARKAKFRFRSTEAGSKFRCKHMSGRWQACKPPKAYKKLKTGKHVFRVRAIDRAGNVDPTPAKRAWRVV